MTTSMDQSREPKKLLAIDRLSVSFMSDDGRANDVVRDLCLTINEGETVALVGESGSGKSVTALSILRLLETAQTVTSGSIFFEGKELVGCDAEAIRKVRGNRIAMIFQEPMTSLNPVYTIGDQLIEPLLLHRGMDKTKAREVAIELLGRTGIQEPETRFHSYPHQLSGGQRQRVMIAMALACQPALLIADEPTTALDVTIQAQILELLRDLQRDIGMAILLITHDLNMVEKIAGRVHIMHQGRIVEHGPTAEVFAAPRDSYTKKLLHSVPKGEPPASRDDQKPLVEIDNLACHFTMKRGFFGRKQKTIKAVDGVTLTIREGTTFGVVGESGSGKSTLGLAILRLVNAKGRMKYLGQDLLGLSSRQMRPLRKNLQIVFQDPFSSLSPRLSIAQIIGEGLAVHGIGGNAKERLALVMKALEEVGLTPEMAHRYPHEFSGGQRQRIAIARAVVLQPRLLILDEPTSALDMTIQAQIIDLLRDLQKRHGMTYLFISHDLRVVRALADDIAVMKDGRIVESGPAAGIFNAPAHEYTQKLFAAAFHLASSPK